MAETSTGLRSLLANPVVYNCFQALVGEKSGKTRLVRDHLRPRPGDRVLDIGCGTGRTFDYMPDTAYFGFDTSAAYVEEARRRYGTRARFTCARVADAYLPDVPACELVMAIGVLHHLDDDEAIALFQLARNHLADGGRVVTVDGAFVPGQNPLARMLLERDRGQNVRTEPAYVALARTVFGQVRSTVRHDLLRIPYTHVILECQA